MNVLVTGGAGYIGSHTAKALALAGHSPVVLDNLCTGHRWAVKWGPLALGNVHDKRLVRRTIESFGIEAVIHFAAHAEVAESVAYPHKYLYGNVTNSLRLLDVMRQTGVRYIVFSSTCATYGIPQEVPIAEAALQLPVNPYGESKRFVERALEWYGLAHGIAWTALRYFNVAGADPEGDLGEEHDPESHLIPLAIQTALGERSWIDVKGTDYPTPDGTAIRDFIHVQDLAQAHIRALEYLLRGSPSGAFNLGTGQGYSVREVIRTVEGIGGRAIRVRQCSRRPGDPPVLVADTSRARQILGWIPRHSSISRIVQSAFDWQAARVRRQAEAAG